MGERSMNELVNKVKITEAGSHRIGTSHTVEIVKVAA